MLARRQIYQGGPGTNVQNQLRLANTEPVILSANVYHVDRSKVIQFRRRGGLPLNIRYKKTFATGWSALEKRLMPSYVWTSDPLTFWRERILFLICFIAAVFGPIALVPSLLFGL
jgi:hypothetical protein